MNFTNAEKGLIIKNVTSILDYIRNDIAPHLREFQIIKFKISESERVVPAMIIINPGKNANIEFTLGMNRTEFYLGDKYDSSYIKTHRDCRQNLWERFDIMYWFIKNWPNIKFNLNQIIENDLNFKHTLENFEV
jgi:hypothetical protein